MQKVVGVRFKEAGKVYHFDPKDIFLEVGDSVIVETIRGVEFGQVASRVRMVTEESLKQPLKPVLRKATHKDEKTHEKNVEKAQEALGICQAQVEKHKLDMKLTRCEYTFDSTKVIFYFTADERIDFRELVKDLAAIFKIRIELRQIGVRDEAKILGGIGPCGVELCCNRWLGDFVPVSIKMAKEQGLSLDPTKITGICGRLLCCLQYEHCCYEDALSRMPSLGDKVKTKEGNGYIEKLNILKETVLVKMDGEDYLLKEFPTSEITVTFSKKNTQKPQKKNRECDCKKQSSENEKTKRK